MMSTRTRSGNTLSPASAAVPKKQNSRRKGKHRAVLSADQEHVKVAIRVRPFNSREKRKGTKLCVSMPNKSSCTIWSEAKQKKKTFHFDYCYWSHNNDQPQGFTKQSDVFDDLGHLYVDNAFKGYNSSVFAYGQTGSGKTYTMLGTAKNPGLIPRGCEELFRRIEQDYADNIQIEIEASYLEVYMDQIFDLLSEPEAAKKKKKTNKKRQKLAVRFHPKKGPFVQGLTKHAVGNYKDIQKLMNVGLAHRTVAETQMNKISSRSHCIFTLHMNQYNNDGDVTASKINLIDLAGSERVNKTGVVGTRMEELKTINKSLSALGDVIAALADHAKFVPYNNSVLTTLLTESLGGNSKTIMMAAISPADDNFDETLSTLRYAERVKRIRQSAKKNKGDSKATVERELRAQITKLKGQLELRSSGNKDQVNQLQSYLDNTKKELRRVKMEHTEKAKKSSLAPKLINISADPSLSGSMVFFITSKEITVGALASDSKPTIGLQSDGDIQSKHAILRAQKVKESNIENAFNTRLYVWKLLFSECDVNKDGFLNKSEFESWSKQVLGGSKTEFQGFSEEEFAKLCTENKLSTKQGVSWDVLQNMFANDGKADAQGFDKNIAEIIGIPKKKINGQLIDDLKSIIFENHNVLTLQMTKYESIAVDFQYDLQDSDIASFQEEIRDLFESSNYAQNIQFLRPNDPQITKLKSRANKQYSIDDSIEKIYVTIESANPTNEHIMIFVNTERIRYNPRELHHGDHIVFGTRHIFQYINPLENASLNLGQDEDGKHGDDEEMEEIFAAERRTHRAVGSISAMQSLMTDRMNNDRFRVGNAEFSN